MIIRKIIGAFSILVFALAIAPKQLMHDAFANHKHFYASKSGESKLGESGFTCNCENIVAESVFLSFQDPILIISQAKYSVFVPHLDNFYSPFLVQGFRLRGPPSLV
jgi:hypothetical protein